MTTLLVSYAHGLVSPDAVGGAEQVLSLVDAGLAARGSPAAVVAPAGSRVAGRLVASHEPSPVLDDAARKAATLAHQAAVARAIEELRPDLLHLHGVDFDGVLPERRPPALVTLHLPPSWYPGAALRRRPSLAFACVSHAQAAQVPPGVPVAGVVPNGVRLDRFRPAASKEPFALVLARICPEKGIDAALDAARAAGLPLLVGGTVFGFPEHRRYFEERVRPRLDADRRFLGRVDGALKARLLAAARCLVVPSRAPETSSLVAMEALASGTPVVARRIGALPEIVEHGRTGFLVDDDADLAEAMKEAARLSPADCRRAAEARFDGRVTVARYVDLYRRILARAGPRPRAVPAARRPGARDACADAGRRTSSRTR